MDFRDSTTFSSFNRLSWFRSPLFIVKPLCGAKKKAQPLGLRLSWSETGLRLEHGFHRQSYATVIDEPGTPGLPTLSVQSHQGFRLGVRQVSTLQADRDFIS